ncbi:hypothetical protein JCGZ_23557 [Jatropha curcas]|uniref:Uncharacterized protein n=1 Tax=Jatropha curcas TaxID=180498 RepID=A0A067JW44_JATCU|nr:uncharacterized protein LOC105647753 [Jatropha curcas]KDP23724.1 hypothetical protein JCGZ_23557 [Jatropha curcas]
MGCFLACFTASKHRKCKHLVDASPSKHHRDGASEALSINISTKEQATEEPITHPNVPREKKLEEKLSCNGKKKVTFDLNDETDKGLSAKEVTDNEMENNEKEEDENKDKEPSNESELIPNLISADGESYPPNNRYQNYRTQEFEDLDIEDSYSNDSRENMVSEGLVQEESSESLFSISIDSRKQISGVEVGEKEVSSPMPKCISSNEELKANGSNQSARNTSLYVDYVLKPVENLTQWKAVKTRATLPLRHQYKENINVQSDSSLVGIIHQEPSLLLLSNNAKTNFDEKKLLDPEITVDTSLSSWLVESETTPLSKGSIDSVISVGNSPPVKIINSPRSHKDGLILGALTVNTFKQVSASTTPRQRSQSPDDIPIIGTIGSYWRHTGRNMDSDSSSSSKGMLTTISKTGEDERVKWNSTPFEARFERAFLG